MKLEFHPYADIFPLLEGQGFDELVEDIRENGLHQPIVIFEDKILDGRNRYRATCKIAEDAKEPEHYWYHSIPYIDNDALGFVLSLNLHRRHLSESQRSMIAATLTEINNSPNSTTQICAKRAATLMNVSERNTVSAKKIIKNGVPELGEKVKTGEVSVAAAVEVANLPKERQRQVLKSNTVKEVARNQRKTKTEKRHTPKETFKLYRIEMDICEFCLDGQGGHCQTPGCGLYKRAAPDFALSEFDELEMNTIEL